MGLYIHCNDSCCSKYIAAKFYGHFKCCSQPHNFIQVVHFEARALWYHGPPTLVRGLARVVEAVTAVTRWQRRRRGDGPLPAGDSYMVPPGGGPRSRGDAGRARLGASCE